MIFDDINCVFYLLYGFINILLYSEKAFMKFISWCYVDVSISLLMGGRGWIFWLGFI